jgi:hypothetical protein
MWIGILPFTPPIIIYKVIVQGNYEVIYTLLFGCIGFMVLVTFMSLLPCLLIALKEKSRLPITFTFSGKKIIISSRGKKEYVYINHCLYTNNFIYSFTSSFFKGIWCQGYTLYIPKTENINIPLSFSDYSKNAYMTFHIPIKSTIEKQSLFNVLKSHNCTYIGIGWSDAILCLLIPSLFVWFHIVVTWGLFIFNYINMYGVCVGNIMGLSTGLVLSISKFTHELTIKQNNNQYRIWNLSIKGFLIFLFIPIIIYAGTEYFCTALFIFVMACMESKLWFNSINKLCGQKNN